MKRRTALQSAFALALLGAARAGFAEAKPSAGEQLRAALARAGAHEKLALIVFQATWCAYCHAFTKYLRAPDVAAILAKRFDIVAFNIDESLGERGNSALELPGVEAVRAQLSGARRTGLPYFVFVKPDGALLATSASNVSGENVGFPVAPDELAHFETMLRKLAPPFTEAEVKVLMKRLVATHMAAG